MIGVDITSIKRFKNKSLTFVKKVLSKREFSEWENNTNKDLYLAQRWAIKEALFKSNNSLHDFSKIDIDRDALGKFKFQNYHISTSKEGDCVIAFVLGEINNA